jgi:hypothetical protein
MAGFEIAEPWQWYIQLQLAIVGEAKARNYILKEDVDE